MSKVLIGVVFVLTAITYYLFTQNQTLTANNLALEGAVATQKEAIESLQNDFTLQTNSLLELQPRDSTRDVKVS